MAQESTILKGTFQSPCDCFEVKGWVDPTCLIDPKCPPTNVIQAGTDWTINVDFGIKGSLVPFMAGTFLIQAFFEGLGTTEEVNVPAAPKVVKVTDGIYDPSVPSYKYDVDIPVSGKELDAGAYNMVVTVTYKNAVDAPGPLAGISDEKLIQIYP